MDHQTMADGTVFLKALEGEDVVAELLAFVGDRKIYAGSFQGIGAAREAELGLWDPEERKYVKATLRGPLEIVSMTGNVTRTEDGAAHVHAHAVIGDRDLKCSGGHLFHAIAEPTCEIVLRPFKGVIDRKAADCGLKLWDLR